ncbi:hypothetical protein SAMN04488243_12219 [Thermus arciformis]|uniref:Uncharacterized protein n=1 Tax=Thermus arciformis TaxID=482827 RepID=A0A1G7HX86_9DEIN|nr:hypothetical protein [Thermus arciformis]SDF05082.1 hypothetical protein SAMN04488243_12219 [Thermus arciformis]
MNRKEAEKVAEALAWLLKCFGRREELVLDFAGSGELALWPSTEPWGPPAFLVSLSGEVRAWRLSLGYLAGDQARRAGYLGLEVTLQHQELGHWDGERIRWKGMDAFPEGLEPAGQAECWKAGVIVTCIPIPGGGTLTTCYFAFPRDFPPLDFRGAFVEERRRIGETTLLTLRIHVALSPEEGVTVVWPLRVKAWFR